MASGGLDTRLWNFSVGVLATSIVGCGPSIVLIGDTESDSTGSDDGFGEGIDPTGGMIGCASDEQCPDGLECVGNVCIDEAVNDEFNDEYGDEYSDYSEYSDDFYCMYYGPDGECCDYSDCPELCDGPEDCGPTQACLPNDFAGMACVDIPQLGSCASTPSLSALPIPAQMPTNGIESLAFLDADPSSEGLELVIGYDVGPPVFVRAAAPSEPVLLPVPVDEGAAAGGVVAGDFSGDGVVDLVVVDAVGDAHLLIGDGVGGFTPGTIFVGGYINGDGTTPVHALDFDGNGTLDIIGLQRGGVPMLALNDGFGVFGPTAEFTPPGMQPVRSLVVGELDGSGPQDVAVSTSETDGVYLGSPVISDVLDPTPGMLPSPPSEGVRRLAIAGTDEDGFDALLGGFIVDNVTVIQSARPQGQVSYVVPVPGEVVGTGDLDGDSIPDLVFAGAALSWAHGAIELDDPAAVFDCYGSATHELGSAELGAVGDFDGNGRSDIAVSAAGELVVYLSTN
ncbi:MAG: VCBS repeat-containing protein [Nannocystaceae bacterium]|nr:VCBS repeat-containing protein [Nannocystaceae bacterium]